MKKSRFLSLVLTLSVLAALFLPVSASALEEPALNCTHAVLLDALHIGDYHLSGQIRVFAHILEIASVQWRTVDVYTGAQQDRFIPIAGFFTDAFAI